MRKEKSQSGFTIAEVLIAAFLTLILLSILFQLFTVGVRIGQEELQRNATESGALLTLKALEKDVMRSTSSGLSLGSQGHRVVLHPLSGVSDQRQLAYLDQLLYWSYEPTEKVLRRSLLQSPPGGSFPGGALRLSPNELSLLPLSGSGELSRSLPRVENFSVQNTQGVQTPNVSALLRVTLECRIEQSQTRQNFQLQKFVRIRNSGN